MTNHHELAWIFQSLTMGASEPSSTIPPNFNWDKLFTLIIRHRVWHQMLPVLEQHQQQISIPCLKRLRAVCEKDTLSLLSKAAETARIATQFTANHIHHCFFKGITLNVWLYESLITRTCKDIDIWVSNRDFEQAESVLVDLGYSRDLPNYDLSGFRKRYYMKRKRDVIYYHPKRRIQVELHFRLNYSGIAFPDPSEDELKTVEIFNTPVCTLQDNKHVLFLIIHGAVHAWTRLRWLYDIARYLSQESSNLEAIIELGKTLQCEHLVEQALLLLQNILPTKHPSLQAMISTFSQRGQKLAKSAQVYLESDYEFKPDASIYHPLFYTYQFYLARIANPKYKSQALLQNLFRIELLFPIVTLPKRLSFLYYVLYPFWVIKLLIFR